MEIKELDRLLRMNTERENDYLRNPGSVSPSYENMEKSFINGKEVYLFQLSTLLDENILIRKDSRYTFVPFYRHTNINLNYIYSGECTYIVDDTYVTLQQGDVCIFDKDVIRAKMRLKENDIVFNISMSNSYFSKSLSNQIADQSILASFIINSLSQNQLHDNYLIFRTNSSPKIISLFHQLLLEYYNKDLYSKEIIQSYIDIIFMELLRLYQNNHNNHLIQISDKSNDKIIGILSYIETHYKDCTIDELSKRFGYHPKYLSTMIKRKTGKNFKEIQLQLKMNHACTYLRNTSLTIQEITEKIGFSNQSFFYKRFVELFHITPQEYRIKNIEV